MDRVKPALVQKISKSETEKWISEYIVNDHPIGRTGEVEFFDHPSWCLSDELIAGFNEKKLFIWDENGKVLKRKGTLAGTTQCLIESGKFYQAGKMPGETDVFFIQTRNLKSWKEEAFFTFSVKSQSYPGKFTSEDILLWVWPIEKDFLVALNGPDGYRIAKFAPLSKDEL